MLAQVRFIVIGDDEAAERKKWEPSEEVKDSNEVLTLQGFGQIRAMAMLQDFLRQRGRACEPEDMEAWQLECTGCANDCMTG